MKSREAKLVKLKGGLRHLAYDYTTGSLGRLPWQHVQSLQYLLVIDTPHQFNKGRQAAQAGLCLLDSLLTGYFAHCLVKTSGPATVTLLLWGFFT